jgi:hypothetical protein
MARLIHILLEMAMRHYDEVGRFEHEGFTVVVDKTWEDFDPWEFFDEWEETRETLYDKINRGVLDWFMLRVRVMLESHVLAVEYLGGCLYECDKVEDVLTDGVVENMLYEALPIARENAKRHLSLLQNVLVGA